MEEKYDLFTRATSRQITHTFVELVWLPHGVIEQPCSLKRKKKKRIPPGSGLPYSHHHWRRNWIIGIFGEVIAVKIQFLGWSIIYTPLLFFWGMTREKLPTKAKGLALGVLSSLIDTCFTEKRLCQHRCEHVIKALLRSFALRIVVPIDVGLWTTVIL